MQAWYWCVRPGATRPGNDRPGPRCDDGRLTPGGRIVPRGTLLWVPGKQDPESRLEETGRGYETVAGPPRPLSRTEIEGLYGRGWRKPDGDRDGAGSVTGAIREHALLRLARFIGAASALRAEQEGGASTGPGTGLRTAYPGNGESVRIDAQAPHHPARWPRRATLQLVLGEAPAITITALSTRAPAVEVGGWPMTAPLAGLPEAVAIAITQSAGLRPKAIRLDTLIQAGRILGGESDRKLVLTAGEGAGYASPREASREWLADTLGRYAVPREQNGADAYGRERPWEIDVRTEAGPGVLWTDGRDVRLTTAHATRTLESEQKVAVQAAIAAVQTRCGADRFWTDASTTAIETIEPGTR